MAKAAKRSGDEKGKVPGRHTPPRDSAVEPPVEEPFEEVWQKYLEEMTKGRMMRDISGDTGMPAPSTILLWARNSPQRTEQYARAREDQMTLALEQMQAVADDGSQDWKEVTDDKGNVRTVFDHEHVQRSKLRVDAMKFRVEKMAPKKYGVQRVDVTSGDKPIPKRVTVEVFGKTLEL